MPGQFAFSGNGEIVNRINALTAIVRLTWEMPPTNLRRMRSPLIIALFLVCTAVQAGPTDGDDDMLRLLQDKGVIFKLGSQLKQARDEVGERASGLVVSAMGFLGVPYRYGGNSADTGFDCSGFVRAVYEQSVGKVLPRRADQQAASTETIDRSDLKPGDLVFFDTMKRAFSHVGIYLGEGKFIHAPRTGSEVRVEDMRKAYWRARFNGARRVPLGEDTATVTPH